MDNKVKYIITCRFSGWSYVKDTTHETGSDLSKTDLMNFKHGDEGWRIDTWTSITLAKSCGN